ncbi:hypothetical protein N9W89_09200 [Hellea sp.]|nr:hypothetical protein [Hellea sp.]
MKIIKTAIAAALLSFISTSAYAANVETSTHTVAQKAHTVKAPVLLSSKTTKSRITRIVIEPVQAPVARDVSMTANNHFVFKSSKNTTTKTYRPSTTTSKVMPNLFKE